MQNEVIEVTKVSGRSYQGKKIIYVAGYGRSGSTLLDMLLGLAPNVVSVGEMSYLFSEVMLGRSCSCGATLSSCAFWGHVLKINDFNVRTAEKITRDVEGGYFHFAIKRDLYKGIWESIFKTLTEITGCELIVDSSKLTRATIFRVRELRRLGFEIYLIHLIRHPYSVAQSIEKGSNQGIRYPGVPLHKLGGVSRGMIGWLVSNLCTERLAYPVASRKMLVRYEDLIKDHSGTISRIGQTFDLPVVEIQNFLARNETLPQGHAVAGNRMRELGVRLDVTAAIDEPKVPGALFSVLRPSVLKLARRYGYEM